MALTVKAAREKDLRTGISPMQHRHYATVATIIREIPEDVLAPASKQALAEYFCFRLRNSNLNFNPARFLAACKQEKAK